jgi:hypothetical protein
MKSRGVVGVFVREEGVRGLAQRRVGVPEDECPFSIPQTVMSAGLPQLILTPLEVMEAM